MVPLLLLTAASVLGVSAPTDLRLWDVWDRRRGRSRGRRWRLLPEGNRSL